MTMAKKLSKEAYEAEGKRILKRLSEEMAKAGITAEEIGKISKLGGYQGITKDDEGEAHIHNLHKWEISPKFEEGPDWPVIQPGPIIKVERPVSSRTKLSDSKVIIPDMQAGHYRLPDGSFDTLHDEVAIDLMLSMLSDIKPNEVIILGDTLDLPDFGKYRKHPNFQYTTQQAVDYISEFLARLRGEVGPNCPIKWMAGNHEERMSNWIIDNAAAAWNLKPAKIEGVRSKWPALSIPALCQVDHYGVEYLPGYPASKVWVTDKLKVVHGYYVKSKAPTTKMYLDNEKVSVIFGHVHRIEKAHRTREDYDGHKEIMAASPGTLSRIDGVVPSTKGAYDLDGRPIFNPEDWQQGFAVVTVDENSGEFDYEQIRIDRGKAWFRGTSYT